MFHAYSSDSTHSTHKTRSARSACGVRSACTRVCYSAQRRAAHLIERQGCKLFYLSGIKHGDHSVQINIPNVTRVCRCALGKAYRRDIVYINDTVTIRITHQGNWPTAL